MFSGSFDIWHWLIVLVIVVAIFGTKKLANAGSDLGAAVRNFKKSMQEGEEEAEAKKKADVGNAESPASTVTEHAEGAQSETQHATHKDNG